MPGTLWTSSSSIIWELFFDIKQVFDDIALSSVIWEANTTVERAIVEEGFRRRTNPAWVPSFDWKASLQNYAKPLVKESDCKEMSAEIGVTQINFSKYRSIYLYKYIKREKKRGKVFKKKPKRNKKPGLSIVLVLKAGKKIKIKSAKYILVCTCISFLFVLWGIVFCCYFYFPLIFCSRLRHKLIAWWLFGRRDHH